MHRWSAFGAVVAAVVAPALPGFRALAQDKPDARQIADAVSPLPEPMREGATVMGYRGHDLVVLRNGTNGMICLADDPAREGFHTSCYHSSLEPFMDRGRAHFWQTIIPTLFRRPHLFPLSINLAAFGLHFRKVAEKVTRGQPANAA